MIKTATNRTANGIQIQANVKAIAPDIFQVQSQTDPSKWYVVTLPNGSCACTDFTFRQTDCKHIQAARMFAWRSGA